jgi:uncharacterized protein YxeA
VKKRFIISGCLTLILGIAPFFLINIEIEPSIESSYVAQEESYNSYETTVETSNSYKYDQDYFNNDYDSYKNK